MGSLQTESWQLFPGLDYHLETVPCSCCGSVRYAVYFDKAKELYNNFDAWFNVVRCHDCGHYFTNPRPTRETISCFYPDFANYYQPKQERIKKKSEARRHLSRSVLANYFDYNFEGLPNILTFLPFLQLRRRLWLSHLPRFVAGGRLLDIGCSWGSYLDRMRDLGWSVQGIELNAKAVEYACNSLGLVVHAGSFDNFIAPDESFDVIHMSMVLEHFHDPSAALVKVYRMLKSGGQLILSVPDISGCEAKIFREKAYTLQVPQHLSHFTPETITRFLVQSGFRVERIVHQRTKSDFVKSATYLDDGWLRRFWLCAPVRNVLLGPLVSLLAFLGRTSRMSVYSVKQAGEVATP